MKSTKIITLFSLMIATFLTGCTMKAGLVESEAYRFKVDIRDGGFFESFVRDGVVFLRGTIITGLDRSNVAELNKYSYKRLMGYVIYAAYDAVSDNVYVMRSNVEIGGKLFVSGPPEKVIKGISQMSSIVSIASNHGTFLEDQRGAVYIGYPCPIGNLEFLSDRICHCCSLFSKKEILQVGGQKRYRAGVLEEHKREGDYGNWWGYSTYIAPADETMKEIFRKLRNREEVSGDEITELYIMKDQLSTGAEHLLKPKGGLLFGCPTSGITQGPYSKLWDIVKHFRSQNRGGQK